MGWFQSKQEQLSKNLQEEQAYALAAYEISNGAIRPGLWAKAFAEAAGDDQRARAVYIKLRVAQVKLGVEVTAEMLARAEKSLASKTPQPAVTSHSDGGCPYCGSADVARHSMTKAPSWCFSCQKSL